MTCFLLQTLTCCSAVAPSNPNPRPVHAPRLPLSQHGSLPRGRAHAAGIDSKPTLPSPA